MPGPGGGFVFFIDYFDQFPSFCAEGEGDCNYLEAAPGNASSGSGIAWCSNASTSLGLDDWDKSAIGAGRTNTAFMLGGTPARCTSGAANAANTYVVTDGAGAGSWWLPSVGELMVMYENLRTAGVGDFSLLPHWSSSENSSTLAFGVDFSGGQVDGFTKSELTTLVRPIRAF